MHSNKSEKTTAQAEVTKAGSQDSSLGLGSRIAPAVALLLMGQSAIAGIPGEPDDGLPGGDLDVGDDAISVPEPSALSLLVVGAVVVGTARYIKNKRRK